jgi:hypothetical protein
VTARNITRRSHSGFALLAVLWIVVGIGLLSFAMTLAARAAVDAAQNRLSATRAHWQDEECIERARSALADVLATRASWLDRPAHWSGVDSAVLAAPTLLNADCHLTIKPIGLALDVNRADRDELERLFVDAGLPAAAAESLADAILCWQGRCDRLPSANAHLTRSLAPGLARPRGGPVADVRELLGVQGFSSAVSAVPALDTLLTTEPGRVFLARAPRPVIASLPGITPAALARLNKLQRDHLAIPDWLTLAEDLPPEARDSIKLHYAELVARSRSEPDAWLVTAKAMAGHNPTVAVTVEMRIERSGDHGAIVWRRETP